MRIGAKSLAGFKSNRNFYFFFGSGLFFFLQIYAEFFGKLQYDIIIKFPPIALLEHRKRRLFATYFPGKHTLGNPLRSPCIFYLSADFWV